MPQSARCAGKQGRSAILPTFQNQKPAPQHPSQFSDRLPRFFIINGAASPSAPTLSPAGNAQRV